MRQFDEPVVHAEEATLRAMTLSDLAQVMKIERRSYPFPWTQGIFQDCMRVGYRCLVMEHLGEMQAYGIASVSAQEGHIMNICVQPDARGAGLGRKLLQALMDYAQEQQADTIFLEVRPSNKSAIRLYRDMGFNEIGVRKDYYPAEQGREDALVFACHLPIDLA